MLYSGIQFTTKWVAGCMECELLWNFVFNALESLKTHYLKTSRGVAMRGVKRARVPGCPNWGDQFDLIWFEWNVMKIPGCVQLK